ncbi:hypothetical protein BDW75DRAFT_220276 [Aspergillus navahoensis]
MLHERRCVGPVHFSKVVDHVTSYVILIPGTVLNMTDAAFLSSFFHYLTSTRRIAWPT